MIIETRRSTRLSALASCAVGSGRTKKRRGEGECAAEPPGGEEHAGFETVPTEMEHREAGDFLDVEATGEEVGDGDSEEEPDSDDLNFIDDRDDDELSGEDDGVSADSDDEDEDEDEDKDEVAETDEEDAADAEAGDDGEYSDPDDIDDVPFAELFPDGVRPGSKCKSNGTPEIRVFSLTSHHPVEATVDDLKNLHRVLQHCPEVHKYYISMEKGNVAENLHMQGVCMAFCRGKAHMKAILHDICKCKRGSGRYWFVRELKGHNPVDTFLGMTGYCQKDSGKPWHRAVNHKITATELAEGWEIYCIYGQASPTSSDSSDSFILRVNTLIYT